MSTTALGIAIALIWGRAEAPDDIGYDQMVEFISVEAVPSKEPHRYDLKLTFNVLADLPKGIKIKFELQEEGVPLQDEEGRSRSFVFTLAEDTRKNIQKTWNPKCRLTVGKYSFQTTINLADQTPEVRKAIEANQKRFPPDKAPWSYSHVYNEFPVGDQAAAAAEFEEMKEFIQGRVEELLELNNEGVDELEKVRKGEAHVKGGRVDVESLKKYLTDWATRMGEVQKTIREAPVNEPGLYLKKYFSVHSELMDMANIIARRIARIELKKALDKHGVALTEFKIKAPGFDDKSYTGPISSLSVKNRYEAIERLLNPVEPKGTEEEQEDKEGEGEKKAESEKAAPEEEKGSDAEKKSSPEEKGTGSKNKKEGTEKASGKKDEGKKKDDQGKSAKKSDTKKDAAKKKSP